MSEPVRQKSYTRELMFTAGLGLAIFLGVWSFRKPAPVLKKHPLVGSSPPPISFEFETGEAGSLATYKGRAMLINFWAVWCQPCMTEMPSLKMLEAHFKDRGLLILAFNTESGGNRFNAKMSGIEMPDKLIFSFDKDQLRPYQVEALPLSVLVDRFGIVRDVFRGPRNWLDPAILRSIEAVLK